MTPFDTPDLNEQRCHWKLTLVCLHHWFSYLFLAGHSLGLPSSSSDDQMSATVISYVIVIVVNDNIITVGASPSLMLESSSLLPSFLLSLWALSEVVAANPKTNTGNVLGKKNFFLFFGAEKIVLRSTSCFALGCSGQKVAVKWTDRISWKVFCIPVPVGLGAFTPSSRNPASLLVPESCKSAGFLICFFTSSVV